MKPIEFIPRLAIFLVVIFYVFIATMGRIVEAERHNQPNPDMPFALSSDGSAVIINEKPEGLDNNISFSNTYCQAVPIKKNINDNQMHCYSKETKNP